MTDDGDAPPEKRTVKLDLRTRSVVHRIDSLGSLETVSGDLAEDQASAEPRLGPSKYEVLRSLGRGGMGEVYLVHDRDLDRDVALKILHGTSSVDAARFVEEAQVLAQLEHPNIVAVHDLGITEDLKPYYTMRYVRGTSLAVVIGGLKDADPRFLRAFSLTRLVQIFLQITQAADYAHAKGVIHRDLKPENVMLGEHGEVQVLDWGLSKVLERARVASTRPAALTQEGQVMGTPLYMAPEQARIPTVIDARTDVYGLGVMLYELLTCTVPFDGPPVEVLAAQLHLPPEPPRARAPQRAIPVELEEVCLKALRKAPAERQQTARELHDEVQAWLESESEKIRRHERAEERAADGRARLEALRQLKRGLHRLEEERDELQRQFHGWESVAEKQPLHDAEDRVAEARRELTLTASDVVAVLSEALGFERDNATARSLLADFFYERLDEAERTKDVTQRDYYAHLVARYHDGRYARQLQGDGTLALTSDPPGAEVVLHELVEEDLQLRPRKPRKLGATPIGPIDVPMGSYVVTLRHGGFRDVRYPVSITRNRDWRGHVRLFNDEGIGEGFVQVAAGPFQQGADPETRGWSLPAAEPEVEDFLIAVHPITLGEYLDFLNDVAQRDAEAAGRHAPRSGAEGSLPVRRPDGTFALTATGSGAMGTARLPVVGVSWHDAVAYCEWRSARDGRTYRLPTDVEWEKAARGVDGRWYPWGDRFDGSLCNVQGSRREKSGPLPIEERETDVSVYGVRGLAGNVRDWTATVATAEEAAGEARVVRGGAWNLPSNISRCANRFWLPPTFVAAYVGFRLARTP